MQHDPNGVGVYLYRPAAADQPSPAEICPDITRALDARNSFVVFFLLMLRADADAEIAFRVDGAVMPIRPVDDTAPIYTSLATCMDDIADISAWLEAWAQSPTREPDLQPDWAVRRRFDFGVVRAIANVISSKIAKSTAHDLRFELTTGQCATLAIPPRLRLVPPQTPDTKVHHALVKQVNLHAKCTMATGQTVHVPQRVIDALGRADGTGEIRVPRPRKAKVHIAKRIRSLREGKASGR